MTTNIENLPNDLRFGELIDSVAEHLRPFAAMWPFCWLKAVAVHEEDLWWRVCYLSLGGRWSDAPPEVEEVEAPGEGIIIISRLMDADITWQTFQSLSHYTLPLLPDVNAYITAYPVTKNIYYQRDLPWRFPEIVTNVSESAGQWKYLFVTGNAPYMPANPPSPAYWRSEGLAQKQAEAELNRRNSFHFHSYVTDHLGAVSSGETYRVDEVHFYLDFPLALRVERDIPKAEAHQQRLLLSCLPPLSLQDLRVLPGQAHNAKSVALPVEVEVNATTAGQWLMNEN